MLRRSLAIASIAALFAGTASAATVNFSATLTAISEVPRSTSTGSGTATVSLDTATHEITYDVTFSSFSSKVISAAIHGPAEAGKNASMVVPLGVNPTSPIHGTAKLTPEQEQQLTAGLFYVNVSSTNNPDGAVRGQLVAAK